MDVSVKIMNLVWGSSAGPAASRLVLLALADFADDSGRCWPSIATIAKKCGISARSVNRCIADLERDGFLRREQRFNQSNVYVVTPDRISPPDNLSPPDISSPPDEMSLDPLTESHLPPDNVGALTTNEPPEEPSQVDTFDEWWSVYPRKDKKLGAKKAYKKALKLTDPETLLAAAKAYRKIREGQDPQFTQMPTTWLNQGSWEDESIVGASPSNIEDWLRDCWKQYDTQAIEQRSGLTYRDPNPPEDCEDIREFNLESRRRWITDNRDDIIRRILAKESNAA